MFSTRALNAYIAAAKIFLGDLAENIHGGFPEISVRQHPGIFSRIPGILPNQQARSPGYFFQNPGIIGWENKRFQPGLGTLTLGLGYFISIPMCMYLYLFGFYLYFISISIPFAFHLHAFTSICFLIDISLSFPFHLYFTCM